MIGFVASRWLVAFALAAAAPCAAQIVTSLSELSDSTDSPVLSPNGKTLAFESTKPDYSSWIFLRPIGGGQPISFAGSDDNEGSPAVPRWAPDGRKIAFLRFYCEQCNSQLFVKSVAQGRERALGEVCMTPPAWTPNGRFLIASVPGKSGNANCHIALIPVDGSRRVTLLRTEGSIVSLSPDGQHLAYAARNRLKLARLTGSFRLDGTPLTLANEPHAITTINWTPSGHELVYQVWSGGILYSKLISTQGGPSSGRVVNAAGTSTSHGFSQTEAGSEPNKGANQLCGVSIFSLLQKSLKRYKPFLGQTNSFMCRRTVDSWHLPPIAMALRSF